MNTSSKLQSWLYIIGAVIFLVSGIVAVIKHTPGFSVDIWGLLVGAFLLIFGGLVFFITDLIR